MNNQTYLDISFQSKYDYIFFSGKIFESNKIIEEFFITLYSILGSSGILFNLILIILILKSATLSFFPYNILLINQLVSNILMASISIPFTLSSLLYRSWNYGSILCKTISAIEVSTKIYIENVPIFNRYIRFPNRYIGDRSSSERVRGHNNRYRPLH